MQFDASSLSIAAAHSMVHTVRDGSRYYSRYCSPVRQTLRGPARKGPMAAPWPDNPSVTQRRDALLASEGDVLLHVHDVILIELPEVEREHLSSLAFDRSSSHGGRLMHEQSDSPDGYLLDHFGNYDLAIHECWCQGVRIASTYCNDYRLVG